MNKPPFLEVVDFAEFSKYYWYRNELEDICKSLKIEYIGSKSELNSYIEQYYLGNNITHKTKKSIEHENEFIIKELTLDTRLIDFGFAMKNEYRAFFATQTGVREFSYTADMAIAVMKVREANDTNFSIRDLIDVYFGKSNYIK